MAKLLLRNARVLDPGRGVDGQLDVAIADGKIAAIAKQQAIEPDMEVLDLSGLVVSPGGFKALGFGDFGPGPIQVAKGVAQTAGLPLYLHIGDFMIPPREVTTPRLFDLLEAGDIATHCYTTSYGGYLDAEGRVYPQALDA